MMVYQLDDVGTYYGSYSQNYILYITEYNTVIEGCII